jgi:hypothetical protein
MKIQIGKDALCHQLAIPAGEYWVSLNSDSGFITLTAGGKDLKIPATKRRAKSKAKIDAVQFYCGGGKMWSLIVTTPKYGEWVALVELK